MLWREPILKPFVPGIALKTVVADPDELFRDDKIFREITERGFTLIFFEESISFRFLYESELREAWDRGENREVVVVVRPDIREVEKLPADLLQNARQLAFYLKDVFPNLSYAVISKLDPMYFDALSLAHAHYAKQPLGEALTKEFILKHVFETVPELIKKDSDLLRALLQRHYRKQQVPASLDDYLLSILAKIGRFMEWPLKAIVPDRSAFFEFLQERWPLFVNSQIGVTSPVGKVAEAAVLKYPGAPIIPFDHDDVRVYMDNLFTEGILKPIECFAKTIKAAPWIQVGLKGEIQAREEVRFEELCKVVEENVPAENANAHAWLTFSLQYGQMLRVWNENVQVLKAIHETRYAELRRMIGKGFSDWVSAAYRGIFNYPAVNPVMVHHIPAFLANRMAQKEASKVAFLLIDGLAMDQWLLLKDTLAPALVGASIQENALMAWIPTITSVSRQAAFSGKIPFYFSETIYRTNRDEYGWRQLWSDRGFQLDEVGFTAFRGEAADLDTIESLLDHRVRALACIIFKVDEIMHGVQVGAPGMAAQVKIWAEDGFLCTLIRRLLAENFHIVISADHGNIEAQGIGTPKEGSLSETKGERCRIYSDQNLRASAQSAFPETVAWDHQGLPKDFNCLLAPQDKAFVPKGQTAVSHGGISPEEVIVPFIEIFRRKTVY
jgi:hypothetical protein